MCGTWEIAETWKEMILDHVQNHGQLTTKARLPIMARNPRDRETWTRTTGLRDTTAGKGRLWRRDQEMRRWILKNEDR